MVSLPWDEKKCLTFPPFVRYEEEEEEEEKEEEEEGKRRENSE